MENRRLLARIREYDEASDGLMGAPRIQEELAGEGETASLTRISRLIARDGLKGIPHVERLVDRLVRYQH